MRGVTGQPTAAGVATSVAKPTTSPASRRSRSETPRLFAATRLPVSSVSSASKRKALAAQLAWRAEGKTTGGSSSKDTTSFSRTTSQTSPRRDGHDANPRKRKNLAQAFGAGGSMPSAPNVSKGLPIRNSTKREEYYIAA